jgi:hypothetical protein
MEAGNLRPDCYPHQAQENYEAHSADEDHPTDIVDPSISVWVLLPSSRRQIQAEYEKEKAQDEKQDRTRLGKVTDGKREKQQ